MPTENPRQRHLFSPRGANCNHRDSSFERLSDAGAGGILRGFPNQVSPLMIRRLLSFSLLAGLPVPAATFTWDGGGNGNIGGSANWNPDGSPPNDGSADLVFSGANEFTPNAQVPYSINTLLFSNITSIVPFTITGEKITLVSNGGTAPFIRNETAYANGFSNVIEFQNEGTVRAQNGNLTFTNTFLTGPAGGGGHTVNVTADSGRTINLGAVAGTGNLRTLGSGTIRFNGANLISGNLELGGTVEVDAAIAGPPVITVGGTTKLLSANRIASTPIEVAGILNLQGFQETLGPLGGAGNIQLGASGDLTIHQNTATTYTGTINGTGLGNLFRKDGTGVLTLGGSSNYSGTTRVTQGTLRAGSASSLSPFADVVIETGATLDLNGYDISVPKAAGPGTLHLPGSSKFSVGGGDDNFTFDGLLTGAGGFYKNGTGTMLLGNSGGTFTGDFWLAGGVIEMVGSGAPSQMARVRVGSGTTLRIPSATTQRFQGGVVLNGAGTGGQGALRIANNGAAPTFLFGAISLVGDSTIVSDSPGIFSPHTVALGTHSLTTSGVGRIQYDAAISGSGTFNIGGSSITELLADNSAFTGPLNLTAGTLELRHDLALGSGSQPMTVAAGTSLQLAADVDISTSRPLALTGSLMVNDGVLGSWTGSGNITVANGGSIVVGAGSKFSLAGSGTVTPPGTLFTGVGAGSTFDMDRDVVTAPGGVTAGISKGGSGDLTLGGQLAGSGGLTVSGGRVILGAANRIADNCPLDVQAGATLRMANFPDKTGGMKGAGNIELGSATLTLTPALSTTEHTHSGIISGTGGIVVESNSATRRQIFSTANTYTGPTTVRTCVLEATAAGALSPSARLTVEGTGQLVLGAAGQTVGSLTGNGTIQHPTATAILTIGAENPAVTWGGSIVGPGGIQVNAAASAVILTTPQPLTGKTQINSGTLVSSGLALSDVTVAAGATLSALGKHASVDCSGVIKNHHFGNIIQPDNLTLRAGSTVEMVLNDWEAGPAIIAEAVNRIGGGIRLTGSLLPALSPGETVVITVIRAGSFSGTATGIPLTLAGDLAAFDGTGFVRVVDHHVEVVLTAAGDMDYFNWIDGYTLGTEADPEDDPDHDGWVNGIEFILGGDPTVMDDGALRPTLVDDGTHLEFTYRRKTRAIYLSPVVEHSTDLQSPWAVAVHGTAGVTISVTPVDASLDLVTVRIPKSGASQRFVRLRAEINPPT